MGRGPPKGLRPLSARITAVTALRSIAKDIEALPSVSRQAARLAMNSVIERKGLPSIRREMQDQAKFPSGYLTKDRLGITQKATDTNLQVKITARHRPTSLARFAQGQSFEGVRRRGSVRVQVGKTTKTIRRAFFVRLRRGQDTSDGFNLGLAIRLKPGERLKGRRLGGSGVQVAPNLYLLYGPSVDQVFRDAGPDAIIRILPDIEKEYTRQFVRLANRA